jgi:hypothetical protein
MATHSFVLTQTWWTTPTEYGNFSPLGNGTFGIVR